MELVRDHLSDLLSPDHGFLDILDDNVGLGKEVALALVDRFSECDGGGKKMLKKALCLECDVTTQTANEVDGGKAFCYGCGTELRGKE